MMYFMRYKRDLNGAAQRGALVPTLTLVLALSGCSAEVGRFDYPSFNLNGGTETGALPKPSEPMVGSSAPLSGSPDSYRGGSYTPAQSSTRSQGVQSAALPPPSSTLSDTPSRYNQTRGYETLNADARPTYQPPRAQPLRQNYNSEPRPAPSIQPASSQGGNVTVERGDTLYGIARRNGVTVNALMRANGLTTANIHPGQSLHLPGGSTDAAAPMNAAPSRSRTAARIPETSLADNRDWRGTYEVQPGDSLYKIARSHDIRVADLQRSNAIENPRQLKPGMVLRVPGSESTIAASNAPSNYEARAESAPPRMIQSTTQPTVINQGRRVAALNAGSMTDAAVPSPHETAKPVRTVAITPGNVAVGKLRRPASGKLISGFGQRPDGTHNDGINIAAPQGADIHAVADGEVVYAGSELKGYGNLILLRHDNGWVTAYAHADRLSVRRGEKVRRGDVIAKVGNTGQVDTPQLHFELRQGSKPVDPLPYLDRL